MQFLNDSVDDMIVDDAHNCFFVWVSPLPE